jgi:hypothetical protein
MHGFDFADAKQIDFRFRQLNREFSDGFASPAGESRYQNSPLTDVSDAMATAKPWRRALRQLRRSPALERGPVLFSEFFRLAVRCRSDVIPPTPTLQRILPPVPLSRPYRAVGQFFRYAVRPVSR